MGSYTCMSDNYKPDSMMILMLSVQMDSTSILHQSTFKTIEHLLYLPAFLPCQGLVKVNEIFSKIVPS